MAAGLIQRWLVVLLCVWLAGCSKQQILAKVTWPEDRVLAQQAISDVETGNADSLAAKLPPELRPQLASAFPKMRASLPTNEPVQVQLVDGRFVERASDNVRLRQAYLAFELSSGGKFALAQFTIIRTGRAATITQLSFNRLPGPATSINSFTLLNKSVSEYLFLLLPLAAVVVTIAGIVRVWRSGRFRWRWLWTIGCLVGFGVLSINWTTGHTSFQPISFQLLSAGIMKVGLIGPWIISVSVPVIAIYILFARRSGAEALEDGALAPGPSVES